MAKKTIHVIFLYLSLTCVVPLHAAPFWTGHMLRAGGGFMADGVQPIDRKGVKGGELQLLGSAAIFYGYEYGWQFDSKIYLSAGLEWAVGYPRNFLSQDDTVLPLWQLWLQPLTHVRLGYVFGHDVLFTVGLVYLWGLTLALKAPVGEHFFVEVQYLQWLDGVTNLYRVDGLLPGLGTAIDVFNVSAGIGYHF